MAVLFPPAEVTGLAVMSLKMLMVSEATKAETATNQNGTLWSAGICRGRCSSLIKASTTELYKNKVISADQKTIDVLSK